MEFGETFERAAKRETKEETGTELQKVRVVCINNDRTESAQFVTVGLLAQDFRGEPEVRELDKITKWDWFSPDDLPSPLYPPSAKILEKYRQGEFF